MSAVAFQAEFVKRFRCRLDLMAGAEFSWDATREGNGSACIGCEGCESPRGALGLAAEGIELVQSQTGLALTWKCPGCGCEVSEDTSALASLRQVDEVKRDGFCYRCRRKGLAPDGGLRVRVL